MSEPIREGDLVQIVRPCPYCGCADDVGLIYVVREIFDTDNPTDCCGDASWDTCANGYKVGDDIGQPLRCLKKIPPLSELEGHPTQEDIREPA